MSDKLFGVRRAERTATFGLLDEGDAAKGTTRRETDVVAKYAALSTAIPASPSANTTRSGRCALRGLLYLARSDTSVHRVSIEVSECRDGSVATCVTETTCFTHRSNSGVFGIGHC